MRIRHRSLSATVAGSLFALTLLSGCGGDEADTASGEPSETASSPTASSSAPEPEESDTGSDQADGGTASAAAFLEQLKAGMGEEGSVHVDMEMTGPFEATAEGDTTYGPDGSEMRVTMTVSNMPEGAMEMVVADGDAYMSIPGVTEPGTFFEVDQSNPMFSGLDQGLSPADSFKAFDAGLQDVQEVGTEEIDGEQTTHYRLKVDAKKAMEASDQPTVPGMPKTLTYEVWMDEQDRMRRLVFEMVGTKVTMDMTDWGEDVTIEAPDQADIVDAPPAMGG